MIQFAKETIPISLEQEMRQSYLDYAMSVIVGRALPDAKDGLKPVHRRVLFAMHELNNDWNKAYKKSARIVGDVIGKYHPHGDQSVYGTIVRLAQDFSMRYPLVDGQGNFGSVDGDPAAAMRYTEVRLSKIAHEMLSDLDKNTVDFGDNYDGSEQEPLLLPTRLPSLLINGSGGIAVGMATNIAPHNLNETIDACLHLLNNSGASINDLMQFIPAPDFPTGAIIYGTAGLSDIYHTGRGRIIIRSKVHFEDLDKGQRQAIIVDELPYQVNKKTLQESIARLIHEKKIEGISHIQDESDKSGMRLVLELKRGEIADVVLNNLYKQTQLQDSFGMNMVALVNGQPKLCNLKDLLQVFLEHRREVVTRRTIFELKKAQNRCHLLEGIAVALANIDQFISIIRQTTTPSLARSELINKSWNCPLIKEIKKDEISDLYQLSEIQTQEILQIRLQRLTGFEQDKVVKEYKETVELINDLMDILAKPQRVSQIIADELNQVKNEFGINNPRRSIIEQDFKDLSTEDLLAPEDKVVTLSHAGYIKTQSLSEYQAQKRGGRGKRAVLTKTEDWIEQLFVANTHDYLLCFSNFGRLYWIKVWQLPEGSSNSLGRPIINLFPLQLEEKITVVLPLTGDKRQFPENNFIFMATNLGTVKKVALNLFSNPRKDGVKAITLKENESLIGAEITDGNFDIMLFSDSGKAMRFEEKHVRSVGRSAHGVRGMRLDEGQNLIAMLTVSEQQKETQTVLIVTENGYGKRTKVEDYPCKLNRGSKGVISIKESKRNGKLITATLVNDKNEIMLITDKGTLVRTRVSEISITGRSTQGVKVIRLTNDAKLSGLQRIDETEEDTKDLEF